MRFFVALASVVAFTLLSSRSDAQDTPLPTRMIPVEGKAMRIWTAGLENRKSGEPVVVLESGAGTGLEHFKSIFAQIAVHAPVVAYDRRGLGLSEVDSMPQTLERVARSLHSLLQEAKVAPPYVLVGASWGGFYIRKFGELFTSEVVGFAFLDATDFPTKAELAQLPSGALEAVYNLPPFPTNIPAGILAEISSMAAGVRSEFSEMRALQPRKDVPVTIVIAGAKVWPGASEEVRSALIQLQIKHQSEWTQASPKGLLVVPSKARHYLFNEEPALVIDAIKYVVENARAMFSR